MVGQFDRSVPWFQGLGYPVRVEAELIDVEIEGTIPPELNGAYYRVGPDQTYPPFHEHHWSVDGNGMLIMFRIKDGRVDYRSRYVETERFKLEREANRALFGLYRNPYLDDPSVIGKNRGTANTTVRMHAGILLALKEDSLGISIEPASLKTIGEYDFDGCVSSKTMTAHPKIDGRTGEMIFFGAMALGEGTPDIACYIADPTGKITKEVWIQGPYPAMMHDFAVTDNWIIFPVMPTVANVERMKAGGPTFNWEPERGMHIGLLPRHGDSKKVTWIEADARWFYHTMNGYETPDGKIHIDVTESEVQTFQFFHVNPEKTWSQEKATPWLTRWTIDPGTGSFSTERIFDMPTEFPRIDERYELGKYRHGFMLLSDPSKPQLEGKATLRPGAFSVPNTFGHFDHETGNVTKVYAGDQMVFEEPQFVPRSADAPEGDGWLIVIRHHHTKGLSELTIFDTQDFESGPVAIAKLPIRFRPGIHGGWASEEELEALYPSIRETA